ncbi:MAG TPA: DMT family transporter [Burkholderiales bacterium]|nr:DMT family transporter [Burkholderiales bacterium]
MAASTAHARSATIGVACTLVGAVGFSGKTVIVKLAYRYGVDTMTLLALRMLFSLPFFLAMALWAGMPGTATRRDWLGIVGLGFIGYYLSSYLDLAGLQYISAGLGRLILYLYPTLVLAFSALFLKTRVGGRELVSLAVSYTGIAIVFGTEMRYGGDMSSIVLGCVLVFLSATAYAGYLVAGTGLVRTLGSMRFTSYASIAATGFVLGTFLPLRGAGALAAPNEVYGLTLILALFCTVLPLWFMTEGLRRIGANQASLVACIGPVATMAMAWIFLDEPITAVQSLGAVLVLAGVMIISFKPAPSS